MTFIFIKRWLRTMDGHSEREELGISNLHKKSVFIRCYIPKQSPNPQFSILPLKNRYSRDVSRDLW